MFIYVRGNIVFSAFTGKYSIMEAGYFIPTDRARTVIHKYISIGIRFYKKSNVSIQFHYIIYHFIKNLLGHPADLK